MVALASPAGAMPPPAPAFKRPTLGLKRDSSYLDTDDEAGLSTTAKKLKVEFNPNVDIRIMDDWRDKSFDLVKEEVRQGIDRHLAAGEKRDDTQYLKLLGLLAQDAFDGEALSGKLLRKYVLAIDSKVSSLGDCGKLVMATLDLSWTGRDEAFVELFTKFICDLASAHGKFLPSIMERLVSNFTKLPALQGRLPGETPVSRTVMFARVHRVIKTLLRRIPSASHALVRTLKLEYPNDVDSNRSYHQYQRHLLRLSDEVLEIRAEIVAMVTQRLVNLDVQIQQDIEDLEEEAEDSLLQRPGAKAKVDDADDSDDSDNESVSESEETMTDDELRLRELRLKVTKMDTTMDLLFAYYAPLIENCSSPESNEAYQQLLAHFSTFILPNRTRHAQFLLFHFAQTSPAHAELFTGQCMRLAMTNLGNISNRLTACAYVASFLARGTRVPADLVRDVFDALGTYLEDMRCQYDATCRGPDRRSYSIYYGVAQALFYMFCFRWRDLIDPSCPTDADTDLDAASDSPDAPDDSVLDEALADGRDLHWLPGVWETLQRNVHARLNPLKVCSPAIVSEFAKLAHHLRFMYVFSLLETNKRLRLGPTAAYYGGGAGVMDVGRRETAWDRKTGERHHQLEAYFPFDPYHLPVSKGWVAGDYNEWKLPKGLEQEEDEEDESESESDEDSDDESLPEEAGLDAPLPDKVSVSS